MTGFHKSAVPDIKKLEFVRNLLSKVESWKADHPGESLRADQQIKLEKRLKREHSLLRRINMQPSPLRQNGAGKVAGPKDASTPRANAAPELVTQSSGAQASAKLAASASSPVSSKQQQGSLPARADPSEGSPKQVFASRQPHNAKPSPLKSAPSFAAPQKLKPQSVQPQAPRPPLQTDASRYSPGVKAGPVSQQSLFARGFGITLPHVSAPQTSPPVQNAPQSQVLSSFTPQSRKSPSGAAVPSPAPQPFALKLDGQRSAESLQLNGQAHKTKVGENGGPRALLGLADDLGVSEALRLSQALQLPDSEAFFAAEGGSPAGPAEVFKKAGQPGGAQQVATLSGRDEVRSGSNGLGARVDDVKARLDALAKSKGLQWVQEGGIVAVERREREGGSVPGERTAAPGGGFREGRTVGGSDVRDGGEEGVEQKGTAGIITCGLGGTGSIPELREKGPTQNRVHEGRVGLEGNGSGTAGKGLSVEQAGEFRSVEKNGGILTGVALSPSKGAAVALGMEAWGGQRSFDLQAANGISSTPDKTDADNGAAGDSPDSSKENRQGKGVVPTPGKGGSSSGVSRKGQERGGKAGKGGDEGKGLVQCDECGKLRILRREGLALREEFNARDWWTCDMAGGGASCEDPEDADVDAFNFLKPKEGLAGGAKRKLGAFGDENERGAGEGFKAGSVKKIKLLGPQKKPKLEAKRGKSPAKHKPLVVKHDVKEEQEGGVGKASSEPSKSKAGAAKERASEGGSPGGASEQHAGSYLVPDGFTLIFTARNTEKSVAINAPGDL